MLIPPYSSLVKKYMDKGGQSRPPGLGLFVSMEISNLDGKGRKLLVCTMLIIDHLQRDRSLADSLLLSLVDQG